MTDCPVILEDTQLCGENNPKSESGWDSISKPGASHVRNVPLSGH